MMHRQHVKSLYRRSLRAAAKSVDSQRAWALQYVQMRFRDDALVRGGGPQTFAIRLREAEDELLRFVHTLQIKDRLSSAEALKLTGLQHGHGSTPEPDVREHNTDAASQKDSAATWDEDAVGAWLQQLGLGEHAPAFARCRVDGRLLLRLDDQDLEEELGVSSRLQRKRILAQLETLREAHGLG